MTVSVISNILFKNEILVEQINRLYDNKSGDDRIFFHETSGRAELSSRQTCAIESAALHNPQRPVQIFFQPNGIGAVNSTSTWLQVLSHYPNVEKIVIDDVEDYFHGSPLEDWYKKGQWRNSKWRVQHMSDYIRMVSLYKAGGMYLDLDVLTLKPYKRHIFFNFVTAKREHFERLINAAIHFERGHRLIDLIMKKQAEEYDPDDYTFNGPEAMTFVIENLCNLTRGDWTLNNCDDLHLLPFYYFHPIGNAGGLIFFYLVNKQGGIVDKLMQQMDALSYGAHIQNFVTKNLIIDASPNSTQVLALLAAKHCPLSFTKCLQFTQN